MDSLPRYPARERLGHELYSLSRANDISLREISKLMNHDHFLSHTAIGSLLKGKTVPRLRLVLEVVRVLEGDADKVQALWAAADAEKREKGASYREPVEPSDGETKETSGWRSSFSLLELEAAHEEIQEKISKNRAREKAAHEEYYDMFEERAKVVGRILRLQAELAAERGDKTALEAQLASLASERKRLTKRIQELEAELSRVQATLLSLSDESSQVNERRADCGNEWARTEEYRAIVLGRQLSDERVRREELERRLHGYEGGR
ncbi:hypothetical protein [Streptomyces sp. RKAG293]|uniref:hypothetical protein n=1 Tax=Streptomyces sp. RKAG293 TaxID=2893403 RepID=UPI00203394F6|nr:hypothetical protein [Streptomyces sp. RKAG293]MCM2417067.1 hypothetical protein [Streptomyces sp. RKAG293]